MPDKRNSKKRGLKTSNSKSKIDRPGSSGEHSNQHLDTKQDLSDSESRDDHKQLADYFIDNNDAYNYSESSSDPEQDIHDDLRAGKKQPRKEFKLVDVKFPETLIKSQSTSKLYWDFLVIIFSVFDSRLFDELRKIEAIHVWRQLKNLHLRLEFDLLCIHDWRCYGLVI